MKKFKTIIFDLDGVIIDSKDNMKKSWNNLKKKLHLKQNFNEYFEYVGYPFEKILSKIGIKNDIDKIKILYKNFSIKNIRYVKINKEMIKTINILRKKKIKLAIVTSKDISRTRIIVKKFRIPIELVVSPKRNMKGKPFPDQLNFALKKLGSSKKNSAYVGDMYVDSQSAANTGIDFIFAQYGYGNMKKSYNRVIKKPIDILKFI